MKNVLRVLALVLALGLAPFATAVAQDKPAAAADAAKAEAKAEEKKDEAKPAEAPKAEAAKAEAAPEEKKDAAAPAAPPAPNKGDTAFMYVATTLVILMTIPGLALFYGGLVRNKNMLSVLMQVFVIFSMVTVLWAIYGYSLAFGGAGKFFGMPVSVHTTDGGHLYSYQYSANGTRYLVFLRVAEDGTPLWERRYPSTAGTFLSQDADVLVEKDDGFYLLGEFNDGDVFSGSGYSLLHIGPDGSFIDAVHYGLGDIQSTIADQLVHTSDNGLIAVSTEHPYYSNAHYRYVSVQRFNAAREPLWSYKYSYGDFHFVSSVVETTDGGILISGQVRLAYPGPFLPYVFKVDSQGQVLWGRLRRFVSPATTYDVIEEADGHLLWLGADSVNTLVARMDSGGAMEEVIRYTLPSSGNFIRWSYDASANERLLAGYAYYPHGLMEVMRVDADLLPPCGWEPGPFPSDSLVTPEVTEFPISLIADTLFSFDSTAVSSTGTLDISNPCLSTEIAKRDHALALPWPNPCSDVLHIPWADHMPHTISIRDAQGRSVRELRLTARGSSMNVDMQGLSPGIYLVRLFSGDVQRSWRVVME